MSSVPIVKQQVVGLLARSIYFSIPFRSTTGVEAISPVSVFILIKYQVSSIEFIDAIYYNSGRGFATLDGTVVASAIWASVVWGGPVKMDSALR